MDPTTSGDDRYLDGSAGQSQSVFLNMPELDWLASNFPVNDFNMDPFDLAGADPVEADQAQDTINIDRQFQGVPPLPQLDLDEMMQAINNPSDYTTANPPIAIPSIPQTSLTGNSAPIASSLTANVVPTINQNTTPGSAQLFLNDQIALPQSSTQITRYGPNYTNLLAYTDQNGQYKPSMQQIQSSQPYYEAPVGQQERQYQNLMPRQPMSSRGDSFLHQQAQLNQHVPPHNLPHQSSQKPDQWTSSEFYGLNYIDCVHKNVLEMLDGPVRILGGRILKDKVCNKRGDKTDPVDVYGHFKDLFPTKMNWDWKDSESKGPTFTYNEEGSWTRSLKLSTKDLATYINKCPRNLVIRVQNHPSQCGIRTNEWDRACRWNKCRRPLIKDGWRRVVFDEFPHLTSNGYKDPLKVVGVMHLYCFEQCFDVGELNARGILVADKRGLKREERHHASLTREGKKCPVENAFDPWMERWKIGQRESNQGNRPTKSTPPDHFDSLSFWLHIHFKDYQPHVRQQTRDVRNENVPEKCQKTLDKHLGNLDWYVERLEASMKRKATKKAREKQALALGSPTLAKTKSTQRRNEKLKQRIEREFEGVKLRTCTRARCVSV